MGSRRTRYQQGRRFNVWGTWIALALCVAFLLGALATLVLGSGGTGAGVLAVFGVFSGLGAYALFSDDGSADGTPPGNDSNIYN